MGPTTPVSALMSAPAVTAAPSAAVREVAGLMARHGVGAVVLVDHGRPEGIVTDRDLVLRALARGADPGGSVRAVMSAPVIAVDVDDEIRAVYDVFRRSGVRRLPVLDGAGIVGMLSVDDMFLDVYRRMSDLLSGPVAGSVLEERYRRNGGPGPPHRAG
ncbi:CBS domain-containing protein [Streptomyces sp. NPDC006798]|uniref:CBS domain-containing protein n=1 Tax=Streptomyces sp. NPDC006798 TaxID=3155462 RepID=UPI0033D2EDF1